MAHTMFLVEPVEESIACVLKLGTEFSSMDRVFCAKLCIKNDFTKYILRCLTTFNIHN